MRRYPYTDEALVARQTSYWTDRGAACLQAHVGEDEWGHCMWLLWKLDAPRGAQVLDIASGVGGVADHMHRQRPDLQFTLLNIAHCQLMKSNLLHLHVQGDMEALPFAAGAFDCAMICYALGHADATTALAEARRVAKRVLVFDILADDHDAWRQVLHYRVPSRRELEAFGEPIELHHADGGRFEPLLPGFWNATGAREFLMTVQ